MKERLAADPISSRRVTHFHVLSVPHERVWPGPPSIGANYAYYIRAVPEKAQGTIAWIRRTF